MIGSNGSGKSTLMRTITGLTPPASGSVYASSRPNMLGVGAALIADLVGRQEHHAWRTWRLATTARKSTRCAKTSSSSLNLKSSSTLPMRTYSSGMSARLKFAIAASKQHDILIVDEALAVGDARFRKRSEAKIREIRENAGTIFLVSHSMNSILDTCNRVIWIEKGVLDDGWGCQDRRRCLQGQKEVTAAQTFGVSYVMPVLNEAGLSARCRCQRPGPGLRRRQGNCPGPWAQHRCDG